MFVYPFCFPHSAGFNPRTHIGGGNVLGRSLHCNHAGFNPRTHTECDMCRRTFTTPTTCFNPRDDHVDTSGVLGWKFQSTHPHGVRRRWREDLRGKRAVSIHAPTQGATFWRSVFCRTPVCFNPRTHTGCDTRALTSANSLPCFNPRTHTGCDLKVWSLPSHDKEFQSTHPHGVRQ